MLALANSALPTSCSRQKRSPYATPNCSRSLLCNTHSCTSVQTQVSPLQAWKQTPLDESRNLFHLSRHAMSSCMRLRDEAYQSSHSFLGAVKLHKGHAAGPAISMHYKVDAIRPHSVACKEPAAMTRMHCVRWAFTVVGSLSGVIQQTSLPAVGAGDKQCHTTCA